MKALCPACFVISILLTTNPGSAGAAEDERPTVIQPDLKRFFEQPGFRLFRARALGLDESALRAMTHAPLSLRLRAPSDLVQLKKLEGPHFRLRRVAGRILARGTVVCAGADPAGLELLQGLDFVLRADLDLAPAAPQPLDHTVPQIQTPAVWAQLDDLGQSLRGQGVLIADLDSAVDVMHPAFFRADGGYFNWLDADGDGQFTPGMDGLDRNGDGLLGEGELLRFFDAQAWSFAASNEPVLDSNDGEFDPGWDHLYLDIIPNSKRDYGPGALFSDLDPAFGEPLYLVDDVDQDGVLDPGEKLVALGSSKIQALFDGQQEFVRGQNLSVVDAGEEASHGTGVVGILAAGSPGLTHLTGVVPDAELLIGAYAMGYYGSLTAHLIWALDKGAQVVLHEYAPWTGTHLDGSTNHEAVMDQAAADGVVMVNPAGNLGGSKKAGRFSVPAAGSVEIPLAVPSGEMRYLQLSLHWRSPDRDLSFGLRLPSGDVVELGSGHYGRYVSAGLWVDGDRDDSSRGTALYDMSVNGYGATDGVPSGAWTLLVSEPQGDPTAADIWVTGYLSDDVSGWGVGFRFVEHDSEEFLICHPATADSAIGVAAYAGHGVLPYDHPSSEGPGALRRYSCRGKRLDGQSALDIAAPDNPLTPACPEDFGWGIEFLHGDLRVFGGTSGAGPHVAGAAVLIKQAHPELDGFEVRDMIRAGALVDEQVVADEHHPVQDLWGAGKLRIYRALYGEDPAPNTPPTISAEPQRIARGQKARLRVQVTDGEDDPSQLSLYFDDDYDGVWDDGPIPGDQTRRASFSELGEYLVKVEVRDSAGARAATLLSLTVVKPSQGCDCTSATVGSNSLWALVFVLLAGRYGLRRRRRRSP